MAALSSLLSAACVERGVDPASVSLPLYHTEAQLEVVECVTQIAKLLSVGAFIGTTGAACRLLVGERGSGKSVILEAREDLFWFCFWAHKCLPLACVPPKCSRERH